ncbi:hypothetical protein H4R33_001900 [Dimargaris cristalligena]|uniref:Zinc-ribbon 15 domain-containing protein n=1 Tax=Dimargaris cristalligena TaxID=215637 RepID=A0A4P9ZRK6_9FUNG|nr:hypothetical protein H4R33_001900 [Dimargaris cristalligena]RKP36037.1 hypothetical protein BJ085DRAFT_35785 [Dimargaris cristalligena]|eukprot:RKP36037.1 hypothetical protein BJ085DRAFT_35785 [Dimargaris cristalligena]
MLDFFLCLICGLEDSKKYLSTEAYMCPNCYTMAVYYVKLRTKFSFFCIPLFPVTKGKVLYLCERCNWASYTGPPQLVARPQPPPGYEVATAVGMVTTQCPSCSQGIQGTGFRYCPHCGHDLK